MRNRWIATCGLMLALGGWGVAQEPAGPGPAVEQPGAPGGMGRDGMGRDGMGRGGMMGPGRGVMGTVTETAADHFLVKNGAGEKWTVYFSVNTRLMKQPPRAAGEAGRERMSGAGTPPQPIKPTDIKVGDAIGAGGEVDEKARSVGAVFILQVDAERAREMREMEANFGKTWLIGRVTAINETRVTVHSAVDNADHTFAADENTAFRRRREPVTLADVQVGDSVRVEGAVKEGQFLATTVHVMMPPAQGGPVKRPGDQAPQ